MAVNTNTKNVQAAEAVLAYIKYLNDPASALDEAAITGKEAEIVKAQKSGDILREIELQSELIGLQNPASAETDLRQAFIDNARSWIEDRGINVSVLVDHEIPRADLEAAGLTVPRRTSRRNPIVRAEEIARIAAEVSGKGPFTIRSVQEACKASPAAVRKFVLDQVDAGSYRKALEVDGTPVRDPNWLGKGRQSTVYESA